MPGLAGRFTAVMRLADPVGGVTRPGGDCTEQERELQRDGQEGRQQP
jgi:hypothetical protein